MDVSVVTDRVEKEGGWITVSRVLLQGPKLRVRGTREANRQSRWFFNLVFAAGFWMGGEGCDRARFPNIIPLML